MRFLIICSFYPPDTAIAAVRPYMLAKHLSLQGHEVTVLRSGEFNHLPDSSYEMLENVEVISYLGNDSDAERYKRGEELAVSKKTQAKSKSKSKYSWLPPFLYKLLSRIYLLLISPSNDRKQIKKANAHFEIQQRSIDELYNKGYSFDCVFSTYSTLENIFAGEYAAGKFSAKWIQDFRDPVTQYNRPGSFWWNIKAKKIQKHALATADMCTAVSEGLAETLSLCLPGVKVEVLYNGYDEDPEDCISEVRKEQLVLCYTGQVYGTRSEALELLLKHLCNLISENMISADSLRFVYAGNDSMKVKTLFEKYNLNSILEDHGYVTRSDALSLQREADVFVVLSWNTDKMQGVLTGKFYEGMKSNKPIISVVVGNRPDSELLIINNRYKYGFCLEEKSDRQQGKQFEDYLCELYHEKMNNGCLSYRTPDELKGVFRYDRIAARLISLSERSNINAV